VIVNQIALWVALVLSNGKSSGAFVYLSAYAFFQLPHGLFAVSITTAIQPELASSFVAANWTGFRYRFARGLRLILTLMIPATALYLGLAQPIVAALLQRGAFNAADTVRVSDTVTAFAVGLPAFSLYLYSLRSFYSMQDTRTPFLLNCLENALNIVGALLLYPAMGIPGLALAFALAYTIAALVTLGVLSRRLGGLRGRQIGSTFARVLVVGAAMGAVAWFVSDAVGYATPASAILAVIVGAIASVGVGIAGLWALRVQELHELRAAFRPATREVAVSE
jgi:putative peptidoglycan lipid II flippase